MTNMRNTIKKKQKIFLLHMPYHCWCRCGHIITTPKRSILPIPDKGGNGQRRGRRKREKDLGNSNNRRVCVLQSSIKRKKYSWQAFMPQKQHVCYLRRDPDRPVRRCWVFVLSQMIIETIWRPILLLWLKVGGGCSTLITAKRMERSIDWQHWSQ